MNPELLLWFRKEEAGLLPKPPPTVPSGAGAGGRGPGLCAVAPWNQEPRGQWPGGFSRAGNTNPASESPCPGLPKAGRLVACLHFGSRSALYLSCAPGSVLKTSIASAEKMGIIIQT